MNGRNIRNFCFVLKQSFILEMLNKNNEKKKFIKVKKNSLLNNLYLDE